ncbi:MAG: hypothetical protein K0S21_3248 [Rhizobiaceae bacterium]|nr:hypothetical protein [Rhizobiaceae bacterium]
MQRPPACGNDATGLGHVTRTTDVLATNGDDRLAFSTSHPYMPAIDISADRSGARVPRVADVYLQNLDTKGENVLVEMQRTQLNKECTHGNWNGQVVQHHQGFRLHSA